MIDKSRNIILLLAVLIFSVSCQDLKKSDKPEDLISESKMVDVLTELSLLHAARNYNKQKLEEIGVNPDTYIYEKFDIDSLQLERSNNWYSEQYAQYERIYDSVKVRVQLMKSKLDSLRDIEVKIEDSLKQAKRDSVEKLDSLKVDGPRKGLKVDSLKQREFEEFIEETNDSLIAPPASAKGRSS